LSVVLDTLYQRDIAARSTEANPPHALTVATYRSLGELKGAIAQRAEETYRHVEASDAAAAAAFPDVLRALVTSADGSSVTARAAALDDFPVGTPGRRLIEAFLSQDVRLLVAQEGRTCAEIKTRSRLEGLLHRYLRAEGAERKTALLDGLSLAEGVDLVKRWHIAAQAPLGAFVAASAAVAHWKRKRLLVAAVTLIAVFAGLAAAASWQSTVA
jgi:hypothetical protein